MPANDADPPRASGLWGDSEEWSLEPAPQHSLAHAMDVILRSGLFEPDWYRDWHPDVAADGVDPLLHFTVQGWREGRCPNRYFDPRWYLSRHADVARAGVNPLLHYITAGEAEGRDPSPNFDLPWYASLHQPEPGLTWLAHFMRHRHTADFSPLPEFDPAYYRTQYPDVAAAGADPFEHYLLYGFREGRNPAADFDTRFYLHRYLGSIADENPLMHFRRHRHVLRLHTTPPPSESQVFQERRRFSRSGPDFETAQALPRSAAPQAKLLAYYLPQFHPVAENNAWWGSGFTEWTAIGRGMPRFAGHYQPRMPGELGHYTLGCTPADTATMHRQVALARGAGLFGFVIYFYWFNGRRLLDGPLEAWLGDASLDFPFCLMWANENWTRRWDGSDDEVLIGQDYDPSDDIALIDCFARHFRDTRYIRVGGRPLLMIYRARDIPDTPARLARWRALFRTRHGESPVLVMSQSFDALDPADHGFDGAIEFPPHKLTAGLQRRNAELSYFDPAATAHVFAYDDVVDASLAEPPPAFPLIKTAVPSWDNDARRQGAGLVLHGSTPARYQAWLEALVVRARAHPFLGEPFVCVNAWNEWAEGAYLEPDMHFGAAYLNATARALTRSRPDEHATKLLLVGHDAFPAGAQHLLLNLARHFRRGFGVQVEYLLLGDGKLAEDYANAAPGVAASDKSLLAGLIERWAARGFRSAIVNTAAAAWIVPLLRDAGMEVTLLVHELPGLIAERHLLPGARAGAEAAARIVFPAAFVRDRFAELAPVRTAHVMPQGSYRMPAFSAKARARLRARLGASKATTLVLGAGYADFRKGFDLFLQAWRAARRRRADVMFCWIGDMDPQLRLHFAPDIAAAEATGRFRCAGFQQDVAPWFSAADVLALTSREDPFPSVVLEAMAAGLPSVAFAGSGGIPDLLATLQFGEVAPMADPTAMAAALLRVAATTRQARTRLARLAREHYDFRSYAQNLLRLAQPDLLPICVIVPNYNYAAYLEQRIASILAQTYPVRDVTLLDDASTDDSVAVVERVAAEWGRDVTIRVNKRNSGSVFQQWRHAAEQATSDYIWIAEADDAADPALLATLAPLLRQHPDIELAFCDSRTVDAANAPIWPSFRDYFLQSSAADLAGGGIFSAREFAARFLSERNLILNVSAVLWRRHSLLAALDRCGPELASYRMAGDWRLYIELMAESTGTIAYVAVPLNVHRRHPASVSAAMDGARHADEIARIHRVVRERLNPDSSTCTRQTEYLRLVSQQLGSEAAA